MNTSVQWINGMEMLALSGSGHQVTMDGPIELGGQNKGIRPMEMLLIGMGGCMTVDVIAIAKKMKLNITQCTANINATRQDDHPKVFTAIHISFVITGKQLNQDKINKAINLSATKYCSASLMLGQTANITFDCKLG